MTESNTESKGPKLYSIDVTLAAFANTKTFKRRNKKVLRTIEIRGDQTLADLHEAIFIAFDDTTNTFTNFSSGRGRRITMVRCFARRSPAQVIPCLAMPRRRGSSR